MGHVCPRLVSVRICVRSSQEFRVSAGIQNVRWPFDCNLCAAIGTSVSFKSQKALMSHTCAVHGTRSE
eukprot:10295927-Karenia_brevis.AAC.1